jgi:fructokinase
MIVVGGEALVDLVISPDGSVAAKLGGGPYNVARTLGRLGRDVGFLSCIARDGFGQQLFEAMVADGVSPAFTARTDLPTTLAAAQLDGSGAASYQFYLSGTSAPALDALPSMPDIVIEAVHVGTLGVVLEPMASTIESFVDSLPPSALLMLDPNCRPSVPADREQVTARVHRLVSRAHVVKVSTEDAEFLQPGTDPLDLADQLIANGVKAVLVTAGSGGTTVVSANGSTLVGAERVVVADTIGAGDAFGAAFLASWLDSGFGADDLTDHHAVTQATRYANQVAGITCSRVGADPPRRHELPPSWGRIER